MVLLTILLATIALGCIYFYRLLRNKQYFWIDRGMPGPKPRLFFLNLPETDSTRNTPYQYWEWSKQFGKIYGIHQAGPALVISDIDLIQEVLVKRFDLYHGRFAPNFGQQPDTDAAAAVFSARGLRWKRLRSITNPAFTVSSFRQPLPQTVQLLPTVQDSISTFLNNLDKFADESSAFDIYPVYQRLTMDVISRVAMGEPVSNQVDNEWHELFMKLFKPDSIYNNKLALTLVCVPELTTLLMPILRLIGFLRRQKPSDSEGRLERKLKKRVEERRKSKEKFDGPLDFIQMFLNAEAEQGWEKQAGVMSPQGQLDMQSLKVAKKLTSEEIVEQCTLFLIAGFDTTANTLAFTTGLLALHPQVQEKVIAEIDQQLPAGEELTYESIQKLKYLHHVTKEVLRLYPLASFVTVRHSPVETELAGHKVPANTSIFVDPWSVHYNKDIWGQDADKFRPERFEKEEKATRHPLAWMPFGAGPRICPGQRFALMEDKLTLVEILRRYRIHRTDDTSVGFRASFKSWRVYRRTMLQVDVIFGPPGTMSPKAVKIRLERRSDNY